MRNPIIIPQPQKITQSVECVKIPSNLSITIPPEGLPALQTVQYILGLSFFVQTGNENTWINCIISTSETSIPPEGYLLEVSGTGVVIRSSTGAGLLYGLITLAQIILHSDGEIACFQIEDYPRFRWRGLLIDEARHFQGKAQIQQILDWMVVFKLNLLHWHLTDNQGWRIEIKSFPALTTIGSSRDKTQSSGFGALRRKYLFEKHKGFYTQEEVKELIDYARDRNIEIVPEFDFPGHFAAAIAAYPHLGCRKQKIQVPGEFGILPYNACIGDKRTLAFIKTVLDEFCGLFPGNIIHIGGDEVDPIDWKQCPLCLAAIQNMGLSRVHDLQDWLMNQMADYLAMKGKKAFVWNDADHGNLSSLLGVTYWIPNKKTKVSSIPKYVKTDSKLVLQPFQSVYFDWPYALVPVRTTYSYDPCRGISEEDQQWVLGVQGALWTEFIDTPDRLQWCLFPRLAALSETAWTAAKKKNFRNFSIRWKQWGDLKKAIGIRSDAPFFVSNPLNPLLRVHILLNSFFCSMRYEQKRMLRKYKRS